MRVLDTEFCKGFIRMCHEGWLQNWHERNGGNASYRMTPEEVESVRDDFNYDRPWKEIGTDIPVQSGEKYMDMVRQAKVPSTDVATLGGEFFLVTGSGKFFQNILRDPEDSICIVEIDPTGTNYRIVWGLVNGGRPTSEFPSHLMNHAVKKRVTNGAYRVVYHGHPQDVIALSFILPNDGIVWTRELWESMTECPIIFHDGIGVLPWMVCGGRDIAVKTSEIMETMDVAIWAHHGMFCASDTFDNCFGLFHTVVKAAGILIKVLSVTPHKLQTITPENFRQLETDPTFSAMFPVKLDEKYLYEKEN